jgi:hypothetical protein
MILRRREAFEMDIGTRPDDATLEDYEQVTATIVMMLTFNIVFMFVNI